MDLVINSVRVGIEEKTRVSINDTVTLHLPSKPKDHVYNV